MNSLESWINGRVRLIFRIEKKTKIAKSNEVNEVVKQKKKGETNI